MDQVCPISVGSSDGLAPLCAALPRPVAGRDPGDDYGSSAALGLAADRQSRFPARATSECAVGAPFDPLCEVIPHHPAGGRLRAATPGRPCPAGVASGVVLDG